MAFTQRLDIEERKDFIRLEQLEGRDVTYGFRIRVSFFKSSGFFKRFLRSGRYVRHAPQASEIEAFFLPLRAIPLLAGRELEADSSTARTFDDLAENTSCLGCCHLAH